MRSAGDIEGRWYCPVARFNYETLFLLGDGSFSLSDRIVFDAERRRDISGTYNRDGETLILTSAQGNVRKFHYTLANETLILRPALNDVAWYIDGLYAMEPRTGEKSYQRSPPGISRSFEGERQERRGIGKPDTVLVGWSRIEITPLPEHFGTSANLRIHDRLDATVVWIEEPQGHHVLVLPDLTGVGSPARETIRSRITHAVGIDMRSFTVGATHSHNAPMVIPAYGKSLGPTRMPDINDQYAEYLSGQVAEAALAAWKSRGLVRFGFGRGIVSEVASTRRVYGPDFQFHSLCVGKDRGVGLVDPEVSVLFFESADRPEDKLVLFSFACHPVGFDPGVGNPYDTMSADMWGVASRRIEALLTPARVTTQGGAGAAGSSNPRMFIDSREWSQVVTLGERIASGVDAALKAMEPPEPLSAFRARSVQVEMAARPPFSSDDHREKVAAWQADPTLTNYYRADMTRAVRNGRVESTVTAWALNQRTAIVFYPDEVCVQFSLETKKYSPFNETVVFGYCDYQIYYVMVGNDQKQGGFEQDESSVQTGEGDKLLSAGRDLVDALARD